MTARTRALWVVGLAVAAASGWFVLRPAPRIETPNAPAQQAAPAVPPPAGAPAAPVAVARPAAPTLAVAPPVPVSPPAIVAAPVPSPAPAPTPRAVVPAPPANPAVPAPSVAAARPAVPAPLRPSFDIVRISPAGDAVLAGRAAPGAQIVITVDGAEIARGEADRAGQWVITPAKPLPSGGHELKVAARQPDGSLLEAEAPVVFVLNDRPAPAPPTLVDISGAVSADTTVKWKPAADAARYRLWWRSTTDPRWRHSRGAAATGQAVLKDVNIDDWFFGVSAIGADGWESPVVFPGAPGSWTHEAPPPAPAAPGTPGSRP